MTDHDNYQWAPSYFRWYDRPGCVVGIFVLSWLIAKFAEYLMIHALRLW